MTLTVSPAVGAAGRVHLVVPGDVDDPRRPSGGNVYDLEVSHELVRLGWDVRRHRVAGPGSPGTTPAQELSRALAGVPDGDVVVVDGLVTTGAEDALSAERHRLALVPLLHLPASLVDDRADALVRERQVLDAAAAVVTTSEWSRRWLAVRHGVGSGRMAVAAPGVRPAALARLSDDGSALTCVAAVLPAKGLDVLADALAAVSDLRWGCRVIGSLERDPGFAFRVRAAVRQSGIGDRVRFAGTLDRAGVAAALATTDLVVLPTRLEVYGMVVTEALARGVPVVASAVGGVPEAVGRTATGEVPGVLVPPGDPAALAEALRAWLTDPALRRRLRAAAASRRGALEGWPATARALHDVLRQVAVNQPAARAVVSR